MGRPLFSKAFQSAPVVRDPAPPCPYEKWSYINAFDPDSDEFFDNEHAVYEDFVDPVDTTTRSEDEDEERDVLVVSDRPSPMALGVEDPAHLVDNLHDLEQTENAGPTPSGLRWEQVQPQPDSRQRDISSSVHRASSISLRRSSLLHHDQIDHVQPSETIAIPPPSAPIPVPIARSRRTPSVDERIPFSPVTPSRQTPITHVIPSPPPTATPRLYSWARNPVPPSPGSPFTNPNARTSYAHLPPTFIRVRDVIF
ncbi:hypothetical protein V8B97DRAFT_1869651 [Scleroderma yunnanense]